jgi:CRP/FNR family cyclic AMP-dependent transcriptional regulator
MVLRFKRSRISLHAARIEHAHKRPQTEQQLGHAHRKNQVFHLKTFLSKAGPGRTIVYVPAKEILFEQGKRGNAVFYILAGAVKLTVDSQGKESTIALLGPRNFAGKECTTAVRPRSTASARTLTNCTILRIERKEMLRVIQNENIFAAFFLDYLLARIPRYQEVIMDQLLNSSEKRLARTLLLLGDFSDGGKPELVIPIIHPEELAEVVGTTRARVSCFTNRFRKLGAFFFIADESLFVTLDESRHLCSSRFHLSIQPAVERLVVGIATAVGKGCRLCLLSAEGTRRNPDSAVPGLLHDVSKQRVARLMRKGHLHATVRWSEHPCSSFRFSELSQPI